jgi:hypothetical protein
MAGDKRKGKVVAEPKKKKTRQEKEWDHVLSMLDTQGQPQRGIQIRESAQGQGEQPQGEQQQQQFRRSGRGHQSAKQIESLPSLARSGLGLVEDTLSRSRHHARGEPQLRSSLSESSRLTTYRSLEVHEQRPSESTSVTSVTFQGRRFGG